MTKPFFFFKNIIAIFLFLCLLSPIGTPFSYEKTVNTCTLIGNTFYVDDDNIHGPWQGTFSYPFQHISDAVENSSENDHIIIRNGTYKETFLIDKKITLTGQHKNHTIIDGFYQPKIIHIITDGVTLENLTIRCSGGKNKDAGILLESSYNQITNCQFFETKTAIRCHDQENQISHCFFHTNGEGINMYKTKHIQISHCTFSHNGLGIYSNQSKYCTIHECKANTNGIAYYFNQSSQINITKTAAYNNNDNQGGFFLESCHDITLNDCIIAHNGFGIKTTQSHNITLTYSTIQYNTHAGALIMDASKDVFFYHCTFTKNMRISIYASQSMITGQYNNIYNSICGLYAERATCHMKENWWGSPKGPSKLEHPIRDNIKQSQSTILSNPWSSQQHNPCGAGWHISDLFDQTPRIHLNLSSIVFQEQDTDQDGVPDWWEETYGYNPFIAEDHETLDPDQDGLTNIQECYTAEWGSDPFYQDVFLEFDWMECRTYDTEVNKPSQQYIQKAEKIYAEQNICLHIDVGNLDGGEQIPYKANFSFADLRDYYWNYFLHNDINNPRKGIFHYGLICDYGPASGFAFMGLDNLDGFCISADILKNSYEIPYPRQRFIMGASIHELGHTLGLTVDDHGGNDNKIATMPFTLQWLKYLRYPSCMNYFYTYLILGYSDGSHGPGDFDDWSHMDFTFFKTTQFILPEQYR